MLKITFVLISLSFVFTKAQNSPSCERTEATLGRPIIYDEQGPKVPASYFARVQINANGVNDGKSTRQSISATYITDGSHSVITSYEGNIYTREIYSSDRKQIITITGSATNKTVPRNCIVRDMDDYGGWDLSNSQYYNKVTVYGSDFFFRFRKGDSKKGQYIRLEDGVKNGIPVKTWTECLQWPSAEGVINMTFSWSNNNTWLPEAGRNPKENIYSVPVSVRVVATGKFGNIDDDVIITNYFEDIGGWISYFNIPSGLYCANLKSMDRKVEPLPKHFSYVTEIVSKNASSMIKENIVFYQSRWFDSEFNLTRLDFRPVVLDQHVNTDNETVKDGVVTQVHDFLTGLAYTIDRKVGSCIIGPIPLDGDDVKNINGHAVITNPLTYIGLGGLDFTWYQETRERGIKANQFRAYNDKTMEVHELYVSTMTDEIQGAHIWNHIQPLKFVTYNLVKPEDEFRLEFNIFNFDKDRPSIFQYDTTDCFKDVDRRRFEFEIKGSITELKLDSIEQFKYNILLFILQNTDVAPLRITHIEMNSRDERTFISFNILEKIGEKIGDGIGENKGELPTDTAIAFFKDQMKMESEVLFIVTPGLSTPITNVVANSLEEIDTLVDPNSQSTKSDSGSTYSPGSMAGLGVGMTILGLLLGAGACYLYVAKRGI